DSSLQSKSRTTFRSGTSPRVDRDVRRFRRVALTGGAVDRVRGQKDLQALQIPGRRPGTLVHVTATNPLCAGRHADLVTHSIIADGGAEGVATMEEIVAREGRIVPAWVGGAIVDRVMPIEI